MRDKYSAVWLSHSSIADYLKCPRLYFLRNVYKDPSSGHKITVMSPPLALGQVVHEVVESLSEVPSDQRLNQPLLKSFERSWGAVSGKKGGFKDNVSEQRYKERGRVMIQRIIDNPEPILSKAVKIRAELPYYWLSEEDNVILCGKIDWLQYRPNDNSVHILDFKTGKREEDPNSLQLPIYLLLATNCQKRVVNGASYWYLETADKPKKVDLPNGDDALNQITKIAKKIALARKINHLECKLQTGCQYCYPLEKVLAGGAELVGTSDYNQDVYVL